MKRTLRARTRPARHALAALILGLLFGALRRLPVDLARRIGAALGRLIGLFARRDRRSMARRLEAALGPDAPPVGDCWASLGRRAVEFALADRLLDRVIVPPEAIARFEAARSSGGVLLATAHLGNWELMAAALAARGFPVHTVASRRQSGPLHDRLAAQRQRLGVVVHPPGGGARAVFDRLRKGEVAAIFVDQATGSRCRPIEFFGRPAPTPTVFERLIARTGATPLLIYSLPCAGGYRVEVEPIAGLDDATARIEAAIRRAPAEWVWLHDRWRDGAG